VTGLSAWHISERFQHLTDTISRYFKRMVDAFSQGPLYTTHVHLPRADLLTANRIVDNPKFFLYFKDAIGAINSTHIACVPSASEQDLMCNHK
ncbi:hypothetical protein PISMIDRAFT_80367, partial [Pisolithus microcarpus 441]